MPAERPHDPTAACPHCGGTKGFSFDRSLCACGAMHDYCEDCGLPLDCPYSQPEVRRIDSAASLHWIVLRGRRIRVSERVQKWWERWGLLIAGHTHTESEYPDAE